MTRLAVVGGGRMGKALLVGALRSSLAAGDAWVVEADPERAAAVRSAHGVRTTALEEAVAAADTVLVAVKPPDVAGVLGAARPHLSPDAVVVSVAAGVTLAELQAALPIRTAVVRAMPNTPALVSAGMTAICAGGDVDEDQLRRAWELFASVGEVIEVPEAWMDAVTAVSGSGPAYVFYLAEAMVEGAVGLGLPREVARRLVVQTVHGAAAMLTQTGDHPLHLREAVSSPGGTTVAAIAVLEQGAVRARLAEALAAAARRSRELGAAHE